MVKGCLNTEVLLNWKAEPKQGFGIFKNKGVMSQFINVGGNGEDAAKDTEKACNGSQEIKNRVWNLPCRE